MEWGGRWRRWRCRRDGGVGRRWSSEERCRSEEEVGGIRDRGTRWRRDGRVRRWSRRYEMEERCSKDVGGRR